MLTDDERKTINHAADVLGPSLRDLATRLRAIAAPRVATVGELLATAPVGAIVEWFESDEWKRVEHPRLGPGTVKYWCASDLRWLPDDGYLWPASLRHAARVVPADQADADPSTRGPIGEG